MELYYFLYIRPENNSHRFPDPPIEMDDETFSLIQTPFGNDRTYLCYITSSEPSITGKLNSTSQFNWQKKNSIAAATDWCNDNIPTEE